MVRVAAPRFVRFLSSSAMVIGLVGLGLSIPTPTLADTLIADAAVKTSSAKRVSGRSDTEADTSVIATVPQARSNGRGRDNAESMESVAQDAELPLAIEFAREDSSSRAGGSNGRGRNNGGIAAEIPTFQIANLTPEALETAAPDTAAAKMARYKEAREQLFEAAAQQEDAYAAYVLLRDYDDTAIASQFPEGGHDAAVAHARAAFVAARDVVAEKQAITSELLLQISGGTSLSEGAVRELNSLLGV